MLGIEYIVDPPDIDEVHDPGELPEALAVRLAREKAVAIRARHPDVPVLAADTLVAVDDQILGKPASREEAERMLAMLAGRDHRVITGVALAWDDTTAEKYDITRVWFRQLDADQIRDYVATGEPMDKAGSYGVQGRGAVLVKKIQGDFFSVMGLPLRLVVELLEKAGLPYRFTR
jgi:septum formation protein